jgi:hypothetical protein
MATLLKVLNNLADIKSAGGVALGLGTQGGAAADNLQSGIAKTLLDMALPGAVTGVGRQIHCRPPNVIGLLLLSVLDQSVSVVEGDASKLLPIIFGAEFD